MTTQAKPISSDLHHLCKSELISNMYYLLLSNKVHCNAVARKPEA